MASAARQRKTESLTFRVSPGDKELLGGAAGTGLDMTSFILEPALARAREAVANAEFTLISDEFRERFVELVERPPLPSERMLARFRDDRHQVVDE